MPPWEQKMADTLLLRALKAQPRSLNLNCKRLDRVPKIIGKFNCVCEVQLKSNKLKDLPPDFADLVQLEVLNLGNNEFEELPLPLVRCYCLKKLFMFNNKLSGLSEQIGRLRNLTVLNLNNNFLTTLPPDIGRLVNLQILYLDNNRLESIPAEVGLLTEMQELHLANNSLTLLPLEMGYLVNLARLHLQHNKLRELPETLTQCYQLKVLDVALNELKIFPTDFSSLPLKEFYWEENPLLQYFPVNSVQEEEVLTLKELTARFILRELKDRWSHLRRAIRRHPEAREMLSQSSKCAVCGESFLNTWLECVWFADVQKTFSLKQALSVPVRALVCSYRCFNTPGHSYMGVAFP